MTDLNKVAKDMDKMFKDIDSMFKKVDQDVDKVFKNIEKIMEQAEAQAQVNSRLTVWEAYRSWVPRKVGKRWYMPGRLLYRKFVLSPGGGHWKYGTEFDVMKDSK